MPLRAMKNSCRCCQFPCTSDTLFAESNIPAIITSEYEDQCSCRIFCSYPNNVFTILPAQLLTLVSFAFTLDAATDCDFVTGPAYTLDNNFIIPYLKLINKTIPEEDLKNNTSERGLGFFAWESLDGTCASGSLVGTDWKAPRVMVIISVALSGIVVIWMLSFACVANKRRYRTILSFLLILVLPLFQSLTFLVFRTNFCEEHDCQLSEGSYTIIAAILVSFFAGILLCVGTTNFPGNPYTKGRRAQRCSNLLFCRNTCRQLVMDPSEEAAAEANAVEMVATNHEVMEVPVESEFFDASLIDGNAIPDAPAPVEIPVAALAPTPPPATIDAAVPTKTV